MTVENTNPIQHFTANGETTAFAINFTVEGKSNLKVTANGLTISVNEYSYDALTNSVVFNVAPVLDTEIAIERITTLERSINYQTYDNSFRPETLNYDLDRIWHVLQEDHITDAEILARIKDEIEWRRTHDTEWDALAQAREGNLFNALKSYMDTIGAMSVPNLFDGITDNVVITEDGVSQRITNRDLKKSITDLEQALNDAVEETVTNIDAERVRATTVESSLTTQIMAEATRAVGIEQGIQTQVNSLGVGNKAYKTYTDMTADTANIPAKSKVTVTNDSDTTKNGDYQYDGTTFTKSVYDPLVQAKAYADSNPLFKSVAVVAGNNVNNFVVDGQYKLAANLAVGNLTNWAQDSGGFHQSGTIFVLSVKAAGVDYPTQIYFPYINNFKIKVRRKLSSTTWESWGTISTLEDLMLIFTKPSDVVANNIALLSEIAQYSYFGKSFTPTEIIGTATYATNTYYVGLNAIHTNIINGNKLKAHIWNPTVGDVEYRIFTGVNVLSSANGYYVPQANTGNYSFSGICKVFPNADNGIDNVIEFDQIISIPANTPFVIAFKHSSLATFRIGHHTVLSGNLVSRGFNLGATNTSGWALNIGATNPSNFLEAGFQFLLDIISSGSTAPSELYKPTLVIPPKFYALEGLETHIYPEHLLVEDHNLYEHDITCNKGSQRVRGYVWTPTGVDPVGNYALTWSLHDKQKGELLSSSTSTIVLADKNAKAGVTKRVSVIGDSLVNGTIITQRLLDVAANDSMKIELIGTRGVGLNKHEGRGGWTINDYTGTGRTYYQFTVSGITVIPSINATTYTVGNAVFMVQETVINNGSGTISCNLVSGTAPTNGTSGTITKTNTSGGDSSISFSNIQTVSGNPFWNEATSQLDYTNYLTKNSIANAPDVVVIQLGVNDTFGLTSDTAVVNFVNTALPKLDTLISTIKTTNSAVKIIIATPPNYADQNAFGINYACGQTSWRARRNIVLFNSKLIQQYSNKEAQNIYVVGSGHNVDTENNFPSGTTQINAHNTNTVTIQTNGVHPDTSGYRQIGDALFACIKVVA